MCTVVSEGFVSFNLPITNGSLSDYKMVLVIGRKKKIKKIESDWRKEPNSRNKSTNSGLFWD